MNGWDKGVLMTVFSLAMLSPMAALGQQRNVGADKDKITTIDLFNDHTDALEQVDYTTMCIWSDSNAPYEWHIAQGSQEELMQTERAKPFLDLLSKFDRLRGQDVMAIVKAVNEDVNGFLTYRTDRDNYNKSEYFASAAETAERGEGDCDDFSILKYELLAGLGVPKDRLYLVMADSRGGSELNHMVLGVDITGTRQGLLILDNRNDSLTWAKDSEMSFFGAMSADDYFMPPMTESQKACDAEMRRGKEDGCTIENPRVASMPFKRG